MGRCTGSVTTESFLVPAGGDPSISRDPVDQTLTLGDSFRWVRDFDEAVTHGMGFRLPVDAVTARDGLDELVLVELVLEQVRRAAGLEPCLTGVLLTS